MDIDLLTTFLELSKTQHFGRAADKLFITQAAVSARIKSLEENLGVQLFDRSTKQVSLTSEGERFIYHAEAIVLAWSNARLELSHGPEAGEVVSIGATAGLWHFALNDKLPGIIEQSKYYINALSYSTQDIVRLLYNQAIDIAIVYESLSDPDVICQPVGNLDLAMFVHESLVGELDIGQLPYLHIDWGESFNRFIEKHFHKGLNNVLHTDNAQMAETLLKSKTGMAYLPGLIASQSPELLSIDKRRAPVFKRKVYACYNRQSLKKSSIKGFIQQLKF